MKAKDLRDKNIEVEDTDKPKQEEDAVTAAYENISKKLESIRNGKEPEEDEEEESSASAKASADEDDLEEWKGPKPPRKESDESKESKDEDDLRKVNLRNLEDKERGEATKGRSDEDEDDSEKELEEKEDDEEEESKESEESKENEEGEEEEPNKENDMKTKKVWEPKENDPLDDEDESESSENESEMEIPYRKDSQPDTLDDLTDEEKPRIAAADSAEGSDGPKEEERTASPDIQEEDEYSIPHLKGSRQIGSNIGYNANPQREGLGESYSPKGNMDNNDPNNFFSQHQPQAGKRANKFHLLVLVVIGILVIGFTVYVLKGGFGDINIGTLPSPSPSQAATPEPTPTPTPEPEVERSEFTVRVLNGTSTSGLAAKVRDKLKELGFKTASPGNASKQDVAQTQVRVKEGSQSAELLQRLTLDLAPDYEAVEGDKLEDKTAYDAEVIIGAR